MISHIHHGASESFWISGALIFATRVSARMACAFANKDHDNVEGWRAGSFVLGLSFIWIATASPLAELDHEMLTAHMVQHLLLMTLAPPLILLGMPRKPMAHGLFLQRFLRFEPMQQLASVVTHPALCWFAAAGTLIVWHIPSMFALGLRSQMWHGIEQASFLATGLLFWCRYPAIAIQLKMARIVRTLVSDFGYLAVRYSFRISGVLRSRGLPGFFVFAPLHWPLCSRRPAMRGRVDVDLRYRRLLNRRGSFHRAFTFAPSIGPSIGRPRDSAIRLATHCGAAHGSAQDGGGLRCHNRPRLPSFHLLRYRSAILRDPRCSQTTGRSRSQK
jgi:hypothetical protein